MGTVDHWNGDDVRALREAMRMSKSAFARQVLGAARTSVIGWENAGVASKIGHVYQAALDGALRRLDDDDRARFQRLRCGENSREGRVEQVNEKLSAAVAGGLAALGAGGDSERADWLLSGAGRPDATAVDNIRRTLHSAMLLDDSLGGAAAQGIVVIQHQLVETLLAECPAKLKPQMLGLYAELTGFAGTLAWDGGDGDNAHRLYQLAYEQAHDAESDDIAAYQLCHLAQLAVDRNHPRVAIDHATRATTWVADSRDLALKSYVALRAAHAYASAGNAAGCEESLDTAADLALGLPVLAPADSLAYFHGPGLYWSVAGECLALIGQAERGADATHKALDLLATGQVRDRALSMLDLHKTLLSGSEPQVDESADWVGQAAALAGATGSPRLRRKVGESRDRLSPWASAAAVKRLDETLAVGSAG